MFRVSIIICTCNRGDSLRETLASIGRCTVPTDLAAELLLVDNASTDHTEQVVGETILHNMPVKYVRERRRGKGYAYNTGMAEARGDIFLFTDDDVRVPPNWIEGMCRPIATAAADAVQGGIRPAPALERTWMKGIYRVALAIVEPRSDTSPESLVGANMAFGKHVLHRVTGFKVELGPGAAGLGDDTLWGLELKLAGYRLQYANGADVEHHFDAVRLDDRYFREWAEKEGTSRAIMDFQWLARRPANPRLLCAWTKVKFALRRLIDWRRHPVPPEWVAYYRARIAYTKKYTQMMDTLR